MFLTHVRHGTCDRMSDVCAQVCATLGALQVCSWLSGPLLCRSSGMERRWGSHGGDGLRCWAIGTLQVFAETAQSQGAMVSVSSFRGI